MNLHTIGIDLGKTIFHLVGLSRSGEVVVRNVHHNLAVVTLYRYLVTGIDAPVFFWNQRAGAEIVILEADNDANVAAPEVLL
jgi:hypothetical protein